MRFTTLAELGCLHSLCVFFLLASSIAGIDFTRSNVNPQDPGSLHRLKALASECIEFGRGNLNGKGEGRRVKEGWKKGKGMGEEGEQEGGAKG